MKPIMLHKKRKIIHNSCVLFLFFLILGTCAWKIYMIYEQCLRIYFVTGHMKKKSLALLHKGPSVQEINILREKIKIMSQQKRKYIKKQINAFVIIDWYLSITAAAQDVIIKQALFNKKFIKILAEAAQESIIELFLQHLSISQSFKKTHVRSCEKLPNNRIVCEIYIEPMVLQK